MLLPPRGQALLRAQHHLLLPLGLIYREHLQESVMGKGEMSSDNPNMQKVLCRLGLINFTNKGEKKTKNLPPLGEKVSVTQLRGGLQEAWWPPPCVF